MTWKDRFRFVCMHAGMTRANEDPMNVSRSSKSSCRAKLRALDLF